MGWSRPWASGSFCRDVAALWFGSQAVAFPDIIFTAHDYVVVFGVHVSLQYLAVLVLALALVVAVRVLGAAHGLGPGDARRVDGRRPRTGDRHPGAMDRARHLTFAPACWRVSPGSWSRRSAARSIRPLASTW